MQKKYSIRPGPNQTIVLGFHEAAAVAEDFDKFKKEIIEAAKKKEKEEKEKANKVSAIKVAILLTLAGPPAGILYLVLLTKLLRSVAPGLL